MLTNKISTKTKSVLDALKENIIAGVFCSNDKLPSMRTLAENFGVSTQVIISVISLLEEEGWVENKGKKGGVVVLGKRTVTEIPKGLKIGIAVSFSDELGSYLHTRKYSAIMKIEELANISGSTVRVFNRYPEPFISDKNVLDIERENLDGIIYIPSSQCLRDVQMDAYRLKGLGLPIVIHQRNMPGFDCVDYDNYHMGWEAASFLYSLGHRDISFLGYKEDEYHWMMERIAGFRVFFSSEQIDATGNILILPCDEGEEPSVNNVKIFLKKTKLNATAIVCGNDILAVRTMETLTEMGIDVPEAMSVIGFDDEMESLRHRLTTFHLSGEAIGEMEYKLITKRIIDKDVNSSTVLNVKCPLLRRNTTKSRKISFGIPADLASVK